MRTALYLVSISIVLLVFFVNGASLISSIEAGNQKEIVTIPRIDQDLSSYGVSCELGLLNKLVHVDIFVNNGSWIKIHSSGPSLLRDAEREEIVFWDGNLTRVIVWAGTPARESIFWITKQRSCNAKKVNDTFLVNMKGDSMLYIRFHGPILLQTNEFNISYNMNEVTVSGLGWSSVIPAGEVDEMQLIFGDNLTIYLNKNIAATIETHISSINWIKIIGDFSEIGALKGAFPWMNS